jgi:DNA repair exonuclease SbcCD ATPase subunit
MTNHIESPHDLPLSPKVKALRKAHEDAKARLDKYRQDNGQYAPRKTLNALDQYVYHVPAIREAEKELREQEIAAAASGKTLPDRDAVLRPIEAKVNEYKRMVPALEVLVSKAHQEYVEGVKAELVPMGLKEAAKAAKARDEYEAAWKAMEAARATLEKHAGLFTLNTGS